nr:hypothetical protein [Tanacetum cinerariifolium]
MGSKEEAERFKRKGIRFQQESEKKLKTSEEVPYEVKSPDEVPEEKVKEMMQLVPIEEVYVKALQVKHLIIDWKVHTEGQRSYWKVTRLGGSSASYQFFMDMLKHLDREDLNQLWALVKESLSIRPTTIKWKLYDMCGVHQVTSKDKEICMLVEKDYPLRKGLAIGMISYKLQVEIYSKMANDLILKIYKIANSPRQQVMEFPLPEEVPTASEESSHCQKKRDATAVKIALLLKSRRNCQSKSYDSQSHMTVSQSLVVPVFNQGDDLIACLNKAMAFLIAVASSRPRNTAWYKEKAMLAEAQDSGQILDEEKIESLVDLGIQDVLMANLSNYGSDVISEVPHFEPYHIDMDNQSLAIHVFNQGDNPSACLNKAMAFLTAIASSSYAGTGYKGNTTSSGGNNTRGQTRVVKCYNCQGEGHMARQCTQSKRPRNATWIKEKEMLAEAHESGQILDEKQLAFFVDPGILDGQAAQTTNLKTVVFHTEDLYAYDSNCDDVSNTKAVMMANLSIHGLDVISETCSTINGRDQGIKEAIKIEGQDESRRSVYRSLESSSGFYK